MSYLNARIRLLAAAQRIGQMSAEKLREELHAIADSMPDAIAHEPPPRPPPLGVLQIHLDDQQGTHMVFEATVHAQTLQKLKEELRDSYLCQSPVRLGQGKYVFGVRVLTVG